MALPSPCVHVQTVETPVHWKDSAHLPAYTFGCWKPRIEMTVQNKKIKNEFIESLQCLGQFCWLRMSECAVRDFGRAHHLQLGIFKDVLVLSQLCEVCVSLE